MGKIAYVDLGKQKVKEVSTPDWMGEKYIGGLGFLAKVLYDNIPEDVNPFDEDNIVGVSAGPYNGAYSGRVSIAAKSPLTGGWGESHTGGGFGPKLRKLGIDALFIKGKADEKSTLIIDDNGIRVQSYNQDNGVYDVVDYFKKELGDSASVLAIGQAGDSLVSFAAISDDGQNYAARGGLGAVVGSKNLKAIVIQTDKKLEQKVKGEYQKRMSTFMKKNLTKYGTANILSFKVGSDFPTKNFTKYDFNFEYKGETIEDIKQFIEEQKVSKTACPKCPVRCKLSLSLDKRIFQIPEYEAFSSLGSNIENPNVYSIAVLNELCNDYGIDLVSAGNALGFFIEAVEKGLIKDECIDPDLKIYLDKGGWGSHSLAEKIIKKISLGEGIGKYLSEGPHIFNHDELFTDVDKAKALYVHVKGVGANGTDPRNHPSQAVSFATSAMGATHLEKMNIYDEGKDNMAKLDEILGREISLPESVKYSEDLSTMSDTLVFCKHIVQSLKNITPELVNGLIKEIFGKEINYEVVASRITDLRRQFNIRHRGEVGDDLPSRFFEPLEDNSAKIDRNWLEENLREYYLLRNWNEDGTIPSERIDELEEEKFILEDLK